MRYRTLGNGMPVSAIALTVDKRAGRRGRDVLADLIHAAMEAGVNAYHIECGEPEVLDTVGRSLAAVERELLFVSLRLGLRAGVSGGLIRDFSANALTRAIDQALAHTGLGYLDHVLLDRPRVGEMPTTALTALIEAREAGRIGLIGVAGANDSVDAYLDMEAFDVLAAPHHPRLAAKDLNRIKAAAGLNMGVIAYDYFPEVFRLQYTTPGVPQKRGLFGGLIGAREPHPLAGAGTFAFLHETANWTAEELCLAYALMEPSVSTVLIRAHHVERLEALAAVPDRDLPPGMAAKVEMARFAMEQDAASGAPEFVAPLDCIIPYHEAFNIIDAFDALKSSIANDAGGFSGAIAPPKVDNIFKEHSRHLREEAVVERSGRNLRAASLTNRSLRAPAPASSLWAKTAAPEDPPGAGIGETFQTSPLPPPDVAQQQQQPPPSPPSPPQEQPLMQAPQTPPEPMAPAAQPSLAPAQMAIWRSKDYDYPVKPTGENFPGPDGRTYLKVDFNGSLTFVPADEMIYPEDTAPPEPPEPPETGAAEDPAAPGFGEQVMRVANGR